MLTGAALICLWIFLPEGSRDRQREGELRGKGRERKRVKREEEGREGEKRREGEWTERERVDRAKKRAKRNRDKERGRRTCWKQRHRETESSHQSWLVTMGMLHIVIYFLSTFPVSVLGCLLEEGKMLYP